MEFQGLKHTPNPYYFDQRIRGPGPFGTPPSPGGGRVPDLADLRVRDPA